MGCGQSKINLYPRRSKRKGSSKKTATAIDKDESEEEEESPESPEHTNAEEVEPEEQDARQHTLPIAEHQPAYEVSASQQNFFKMLDDKIEQGSFLNYDRLWHHRNIKRERLVVPQHSNRADVILLLFLFAIHGKDYDSSSETEIQEEQERRRRLIEHWRAHSQSTQSSLSHSSPPTPAAKRRLTRSVSRISERQCAPSTSKQCYWQESPPSRRSHSVKMTHEPRPCTSDWEPSTKSPVKRSQSAGPTWRNNTKVAPMPKPKSDKKDQAVAGCSKDSQITYNPTFQNHSPAHSAKSQPYIAQIVAHPLSQQVAPSSPLHIAPPEEYQDPKVSTIDMQTTVTQVSTQSQIYHIHGNNTATATSPDIMQQRQQTVIHLKQYVAMKQAQQQMFTSYMQCPPNAPRLCEGEELAAQYGYPGFRPQSAPNRPGFAAADVTHMNAQICSPLPPVMTTPLVGGQVPPEMQYYPQSQFVPMFRANSAGSAGTLTRYHKKEETEKSVQSISVVRGKPVGQIVSVGGQELAVTRALTDSPSPASVSTDSGVSPGTSAPSSKSSFSTTPPTTRANDVFDPNAKPKKNKSGQNRTIKVSKSLDS